MAAKATILGFRITVEKNLDQSKDKYSVSISHKSGASLLSNANSFIEAFIKASKFIKNNS